MKTSVIRQRVADFLKQHHPFDALSEDDLLTLAGSGKVKFHESDEYLHRRGDPKGQFLWMIQQGRIELLEETPAGERLHDVLGEGDLLGLEQFLGDGSYLHAARTATDVILYGVAAELFESLPARYPAVHSFLSARFSMAGSLGVNRTSWLDADPPPAAFLQSRLTAIPAASPAQDIAAHLNGSANAAIALIDHHGHLAAALTATQFCAAQPPSSPPTIAAPLTTRRAVRALLNSNSELLAITADGTPNSPLQGLVTARELAHFCGHDPAGLLQGIRRARSLDEITPLIHLATRQLLAALADPQDVDDCAILAAALNSATSDACIRLTAAGVRSAGLAPSQAPACWIMFGATARGDQLCPELPAIAAIYDDDHPAFHPRDSLYYTALAGETGSRFHACGLQGPDAIWPAGAQPGMPLSQWRRLFTETIGNPIGHNLYARREFFDCQQFSGHSEILSGLQRHILTELANNPATIPLLANDTLVHLPPLTFFRGLVLELDGAHSQNVNIAQSVVSPIADAARVFALSKGRLTPVNTLSRLAAARIDYPQGAAILAEAADAYRIGLYYQALAGGDLIEPDKLGKFDHLLLKNAFSFIHRFLEFTVSQFMPGC